uniref:Peptidase A2 domain-containing protein n=1 Tax=Haemonchus contortus TaxID=6289 RepID=A0A7I4YYP8_HAECO
MKEVEILLDTGADRSFISGKLANELNLPNIDSVDLSVYTFGNKAPRHQKCEVCELQLWDNQGNIHSLSLCITDVITEKGRQARLTSEDQKYLQQQGITLTKSEKTLTNPQVLLGCDTLCPLLNCAGTLHVLKSGLFAIPSKLGYLLSGKQELCQRKRITDTKVNDSGEKTTIAQLNAQEAAELERWDRYWSLDTCGIEEFTGTKNAEKSHVNEEVEKFFNDTIEKRSDGYYVRLPFKDSGETLPTNKSLAYSRLISVVNTLQKDPKLLEQYHGVFQEQLEKGIIEEVVENDKESSTPIHYLPHQPVITPLKETTKLRIVFDASSHCKGQTSLNDILHQGPLILPELYGILLRFRMKNFVVTADVEKAFLQVRLNECDRDVTRCLWIRDRNRPPWVTT